MQDASGLTGGLQASAPKPCHPFKALTSVRAWRRMLDYGAPACAAHVTGREKWPGFPSLSKAEREQAAKRQAQQAPQAGEASPVHGGA